MGDFIACGPSGEHASVGISRKKKSFGALVQANVIAVGEVVLGRKTVWRIYEQRGNECQRDHNHDCFPRRQPPPDRRNADENHERDYGKHVAGEHRASDHREADEVLRCRLGPVDLHLEGADLGVLVDQTYRSRYPTVCQSLSRNARNIRKGCSVACTL